MKKSFVLLMIAVSLLFTSCYSVFSGGTGGRVVDAESTASPKKGIADVDVYAYSDEETRNKDFSNWSGGRFSPSSTGYVKTVSDNDGSFTLNKIYWKNKKPAFGKDADSSRIFLLFYHENYGLVKGDTVIVSDSLTTNIYQELTAVRKSTDLHIRLIDVGTGRETSNSLTVKVSVPQENGHDKIFEQTVTGNGIISVNYPRNSNPTAKITYEMSGEKTWKACFNNDSTEKYKFKDDSSMNVILSGSSITVECYGKPTRIYVPDVSGTTTSPGTKVTLTATKYNEVSIDCKEAFSSPQSIGSGSTTINSFRFNNQGRYWTDDTYETADVDITMVFNPSNTLTVKNTSEEVSVSL